jgi:pantoate--beta-alanine ligase
MTNRGIMLKTARTRVCRSLKELSAWRNAAIGRIGLVPTMGALHEGHLQLIRRAKEDADLVIVSIFVNPLQFAPHEDFSKYPRTFDRDLSLCESEGVDAIFYPQADELVHGSSQQSVTTVVPPPALVETMEGKFRPGFFTGVATIVCKLFNAVRPDTAFFGEKDYQQLQVVKRMVADLNMPLAITAVPTVREHDGLALSSRNVYLNDEQRALAPILQKTLREVLDAIVAGTAVEAALTAGREKLSNISGISLQYLEACDGNTLESITAPTTPMAVLLAAKLGEVRLIDNIVQKGPAQH